MSVFNLVDITQARRLTENDNVISSTIFTFDDKYEDINTYIKGVDTFIKMEHNFKLLLFHDNSVPASVIRRWEKSSKLVLCEFTGPCSNGMNGLFGTIIRYLPMFTTDIKFNYCTVADVDRHPGQWKRDFKNFLNVISSETDKIVYNIPLAGELLTRNIAARDLIQLQSWYRISAYPITFKYGTTLPTEVLDEFIFDKVDTPEYAEVVNYILQYEYEKVHPGQGKFIYGCDELFLCYVMKYHEDHNIDFVYTVNVYTHRSPFYYWLEQIKPSQEKRDEFLELVESKDDNISEFLKKFDNTKRRELYTLIKDKFGPDLTFFEDKVIIDCMKRFIMYIDKDPENLYLKKFPNKD